MTRSDSARRDPETAPDAACMACIHAAANDLDRAWSEAEFAALLESPHVLSLGDARAFMLGRIIADEAEILTIATHPDHRRAGLARRLLQRFHDAAHARGVTYTFLEVAADNAAAHALYLDAGYTQTGRRQAYYARRDGPAADALILQYRLT